MSSRDVRFQVLVLPNVSWTEQLRRVRHVEALGFDVVATADHLVDWTGPEKPILEAWTGLAALASETSTIRLTTAVLQIPLRHPALLAHMAVTLDHISNGRLEVGIGTGLKIDPGTEMAGLENWSNSERVARLGEYAQVLHLLMSQEVTSFEGEFYRIDDMVTNPLPVQDPRPPIMIAAMGPNMLKQAALHADIWNSLSFKPTWEEQLEETQQRVEQMRANCAEIGRGPSEIRWSFTFYESDSRHRGGHLNYYDSEEAFTDRVSAMLDLGFTEISLYYPFVEAQIPMFEHLAKNVIPTLKKH